MSLAVEDQCDELKRLAACFFQAVPLAVADEGDIAWSDLNDHAVVGVLAVPAEDIVRLSVAVVDVPADLCVDGENSVREETTLAVHFVRAGEYRVNLALARAVEKLLMHGGDLVFTSDK